jgi:16S rRNA (uracil1498-N3)-methyltransferase
MHRFFLYPEHFGKKEIVVEDPQLCHQWSKVLRFSVGDSVILCDGNQNEYLCRFTEISQKKAVLDIEEKRIKKEKFPCDVHLYIPILNNQNRFELVLEKGTELGVKSFTPLITKRTQAKHLRKFDRLLNIVKEAAEQSGRSILPQLFEVTKLEPALKSVPEGEEILLGYIGPSEKLFDMKVKKHPIYHVFIGPEGDFDESELLLFKEQGATPFSLGKQILRTETAAISSATILLCR